MGQSAIAGVTLIVVAYLLGSIPTGLVFGYLLKGVDLRKIGSGGTGTTNAQRVLGTKVSVLVLVIDLCKGIIPVAIGHIADLAWWAIGLGAVAAVAGHCWSVYIGFNGGKGMATGGAAAIAMFPPFIIYPFVMALLVWRTRYVSLASIFAAVTGPPIITVAAVLDAANWWAVVGSWAIGAMILIKHWGNIQRLRTGTERRLGERVAPARSA